MHDRLHPIGKNIELTLWPESSGATRVKLADERHPLPKTVTGPNVHCASRQSAVLSK